MHDLIMNTTDDLDWLFMGIKRGVLLSTGVKAPTSPSTITDPPLQATTHADIAAPSDPNTAEAPSQDYSGS